MSALNEPPRGQPYGDRKATEASLAAVPMGEPGQVEPAPQQRRDPMQVAQETSLPNLAVMDDAGVRSTMAGLPQASPPNAPMPTASREAMALLPLLPQLEQIARMESTGPGFRRWYRHVVASLPPEVSTRDLG